MGTRFVSFMIPVPFRAWVLNLLVWSCCAVTAVADSPPAPEFGAPQIISNLGHGAIKVVASSIYPGHDSSGQTLDKRLPISFTASGSRDVAVADAASQLITIKRGPLASATFADVTLAVDGSPTDLAVADLNNDGLPDVLICASGAVEVFINTYDRSADTNPQHTLTFADPVTYSVTDPNDDTSTLRLKSLAVLHTDLPQYTGTPPDVIAVCSVGVPGNDGYHGYLVHFYNQADGHGTLGATPDVFELQDGATLVAVGDLNNDEYSDIVTADAATGKVEIIRNVSAADNTRSIDPAIAVPDRTFASGYVAAIALGDIDADGARDLLMLNADSSFSDGHTTLSSRLSLYHNDGTGALGSPSSLSVKQVTSDSVYTVRGNLAIGDLNGDNTTGEVAVTDGLDDTVTLVTMDPAGITRNNGLIYGTKSTVIAGPYARYVEIGDLDGDGSQDLFVANGDTSDAVPASLFLGGTGDGGVGGSSVHVEFATMGENISEGGVAHIVVNRGSATTGAFSVSFTVGGTATVNNGHNKSTADYQVTSTDPAIKFNAARKSGTISFTASEATKTVTVSIATNPAGELNETVTLLLGTATPFTVGVGDNKLHTLTIVDSQKPAVRPPGALAVSPSNVIRHTPAELRGFGVVAVGRTNSDWSFTVAQAADPLAAHLALKVQYSLTATNDEWIDLLPLTHKAGTIWTGTTSQVPVGTGTHNEVYFRTVSTADGYQATNGRPTKAYSVVPGPKLDLTVTQAPAGQSSNPGSFGTSAVTTYNSDEVQYVVKLVNNGNAEATNVQIYLPSSAFADARGNPTALKNHFLTATSPLQAGATLQFFDKNGRVTTGTGLAVAGQVTIPHLQPGQLESVTVSMATLSTAEYNPRDQNASTGKTVVYTGYDVTAKDQNILHRPGNPESLVAIVSSPLEVLVSTKNSGDNPNIATTGGTIEYDFTINNHANFAFKEVKFQDAVPYGTALLGVYGQNDSGDFTAEPIITNTSPTGNPAVPLYQYGQTQTLTWTVGNIPARTSRNIKYTVKVLNDLPTSYFDQNGVSHTTEVDNGGYNVTATPPSGGVVYAYKTPATDALAKRTLISAENPEAAPQVRFEKRAVSEGANAGGEIREVTNRVPVDIATVLPNDPIRYTLYYRNYSNTTALNCVIQDQIPAGGTFTGFVTINGQDPLPNQYVFRTATGVVLPLPNHTLAQDLKLAKVVEFHVGNLDGSATGEVTYKVAATVAADVTLTAPDARMWTASLLQPVACSPAVAPVRTVRPISFEKETRTDKSSIGESEVLTYTLTYRNNGGTTAYNSRVHIPIPAGTTYVVGSATFLNDQQQPINPGFPVEPPTHADNSCDFVPGSLAPNSHGMVRFQVRVNSPLLPAYRVPGAQIACKPTVQGAYLSGSVVQAAKFGERFTADAARQITVPAEADVQETQVRLGASNPHLWALKIYPNFVYSGQKLQYQLAWGNSGDGALPGIQAAIQVPSGTVLVPEDTTPGYDAREATKGIIKWNFPPLAGHGSGAAILVVRVLNDSVYKNDTLEENSAYVASTNALKTGIVPGPAATLVLSSSPVVSAWQSFGAVLRGIGGNLFGQGNTKLEGAVHSLNGNATSMTIREADVFTLNNGVLLIPNGGNQLVASGGGNLVASGGGNLVASGGGNLQAAGGAYAVRAGAGSAMTFAGIGTCTAANLADFVFNGLVASGGGNLVASGGGNVISRDGAGVISNDGGSLISQDGGGIVSHDAGGLVASGGGNLVASGGGNLVASGGGNLVASGGGNLTENLLASRSGVVTVVGDNGTGFISAGRLISQDGGGIVSHDAAGIISQDGGGIISLTSGQALVPSANSLFSNSASGFGPK